MPVHRIDASTRAAWRIGWALAGRNESDLGIHSTFAILQLQTAALSRIAATHLQAAQGCAARAFAAQEAHSLQPGASIVALASPFGVVAPHYFSNMAITGSALRWL
ncbi:hypothetical protein WJX84_001944 [Apatococcus fuscideae]|uniref:Uncharacterized protein n=1 Tax=Apatococcus fuscideae TaxID=2026836 RepID=A0AAW1SK50_9CHLO